MSSWLIGGALLLDVLGEVLVLHHAVKMDQVLGWRGDISEISIVVFLLALFSSIIALLTDVECIRGTIFYNNGHIRIFVRNTCLFLLSGLMAAWKDGVILLFLLSTILYSSLWYTTRVMTKVFRYNLGSTLLRELEAWLHQLVIQLLASQAVCTKQLLFLGVQIYFPQVA